MRRRARHWRTSATRPASSSARIATAPGCAGDVADSPATRRPARPCRPGTRCNEPRWRTRVSTTRSTKIGPGGILRGRWRRDWFGRSVRRPIRRSGGRRGGRPAVIGRAPVSASNRWSFSSGSVRLRMSPGRTRWSESTIATMSLSAAVTWSSSSLPRYSTTSARARNAADVAAGLAELEVLRPEARRRACVPPVDRRHRPSAAGPGSDQSAGPDELACRRVDRRPRRSSSTGCR